MTAPARAPLAGIRILAIEQFGAGPFATLLLTDLGADVIKIEDPSTGGDVGRSVPPGATDGHSLYFETFNRGKRSLALDLKNPAGRSVFERLVAGADAVFNNLRGDLPDRLGLTYTALGAINPRIVCVSLSAYGRTGSRCTEPGYDALIQAEAGWAALTGEPGGPPARSGLPLVDYAAGLAAALGLVAGILDARQTGHGRDVDTSLYDVALALLTYPATWQRTLGIETHRQPLSAHPSIVPFQFFATADGYLAVACAKEKFFQELVTRMGLAELASDPRFATFASRHDHRNELLAILAAEFARRPTSEWLARLRGAVPCAPIRSFAEALNASELMERGMAADYDHPVFGEVRAIGSPFHVSGYHPVYAPAPALGADQRAVLRQAGYDDAEIAVLAASGAFGTSPVTR